MTDPQKKDDPKQETPPPKNPAEEVVSDQKNDDVDDLNQKIKEAEKADEQQSSQAGQTQGDDGSTGDQDENTQVQELKNALARAMADLQNFKRRSEEERGQFVKFANVELLKELLPIVDNLSRSAGHLPVDLKDNDWAKGVLQIHQDLLKSLEKMGVQKMQTVGQKLDPNQHEALMSAPGEQDVIVEEFEPGYTYHGQTLKAAKVKVGDGQ